MFNFLATVYLVPSEDLAGGDIRLASEAFQRLQRFPTDPFPILELRQNPEIVNLYVIQKRRSADLKVLKL